MGHDGPAPDQEGNGSDRKRIGPTKAKGGDVKVVILCGGFGTRIRNVAEDIPKPMIPIGNYPILLHVMRHYARHGFKRFILCLGYKGAVIKDFFLNYRSHTADITIDFSSGQDVTFEGRREEIDWTVTLAETGLDALTGSRLKKIEPYLKDDDDFMLTYGDGVSDIDLSALLAFHRRHGRMLTISGVRPPGRFGEVEHDGAGQVLQFNEKPQASGGRISGGFMVCRRQALDYLTAGRDDETLEAAPMRRLAREGQMMMYAHDGFWQCMDTARDYQILNELYRSGRAPWVSW